MKFTLVLLISGILMFGLIVRHPQTVSAQIYPLAYPEIITTLNSTLPNELFKTKAEITAYLLAQIRQRKVNGVLTAEREQDLRRSGASNELISAIRRNSPSGIDNISPTTSAGTVRKNALGIELVYIPAGEFMMGSTEEEVDGALSKCKKIDPTCERSRFTNETPRHKVAIKDNFWMGRYEVTQAQWESVIGNNPSRNKVCGDNCPVEQVSWDDVQLFLKKLNDKNDGLIYNLPSEAEWEYAARAGTTTAFAFGDTLSLSQANFNGNYPDASAKKQFPFKTVPVGSYPPNAWGLYDMHGNVNEWCQDIYNSSYANLPVDGSANLSAGNPDRRILRGGSWNFFEYNLRSADRLRYPSEKRDYVFGFRVVARPK